MVVTARRRARPVTPRPPGVALHHDGWTVEVRGEAHGRWVILAYLGTGSLTLILAMGILLGPPDLTNPLLTAIMGPLILQAGVLFRLLAKPLRVRIARRDAMVRITLTGWIRTRTETAVLHVPGQIAMSGSPTAPFGIEIERSDGLRELILLFDSAILAWLPSALAEAKADAHRRAGTADPPAVAGLDRLVGSARSEPLGDR